MILSEAEIRELTGRLQRKAQARALAAMCIECKSRPDGSLVVSRAHVEAVLGGVLSSVKGRKTQPDFSMVK